MAIDKCVVDECSRSSAKRATPPEVTEMDWQTRGGGSVALQCWFDISLQASDSEFKAPSRCKAS
jgi:hypothetical protein